MAVMLSKAQFKPKVLAFLRQVEETGEELIITDRGRPVVRIVPAAGRSLADIQKRWAGKVAEGTVRYDPDDAVHPLPDEAWGGLRGEET